MRNLDRRWWVAIAVAVVAVVALVYSLLQKPPAECGPVLDMLEFNAEQGELIREQSEGAGGVPTVADEVVYQQWADGLAERARNVDEPSLRIAAVEIADLAATFVQKMAEVRAVATDRAPGAPTPTVVYEMSALDEQIRRKTADLAKACEA